VKDKVKGRIEKIGEGREISTRKAMKNGPGEMKGLKKEKYGSNGTCLSGEIASWGSQKLRPIPSAKKGGGKRAGGRGILGGEVGIEERG